jgi:hypothetical protein
MTESKERLRSAPKRPLGFERIGYVVIDGVLRPVDPVAQEDFSKRLLELSVRINDKPTNG